MKILLSRYRNSDINNYECYYDSGFVEYITKINMDSQVLMMNYHSFGCILYHFRRFLFVNLYIFHANSCEVTIQKVR